MYCCLVRMRAGKVVPVRQLWRKRLRESLVLRIFALVLLGEAPEAMHASMPLGLKRPNGLFSGAGAVQSHMRRVSPPPRSVPASTNLHEAGMLCALPFRPALLFTCRAEEPPEPQHGCRRWAAACRGPILPGGAVPSGRGRHVSVFRLPGPALRVSGCWV